MKAAVLYEPHTPLRVEEVDLDAPRAGEVRIKLAGGGVCHSDYHRIDGHTAIETLPFVMGHEGAGVVQEVGPEVAGLAAGDHVIFSLTPSAAAVATAWRGVPTSARGPRRPPA